MLQLRKHLLKVLLRCHAQHASREQDWSVRVRLRWHCDFCQELR
jgi:hypothetical protein